MRHKYPVSRPRKPVSICCKLSCFLFLAFLNFHVAAQTQRGNIYAVIVGVSEYSNSYNNLIYPSRDALEMYDLIKLHTTADKVVLLTNRQATRENILRYANHIFAKAGHNDIVLFFFSGHGYEGGFLAYDMGLSYRDLKRTFKRAKASRKLIFADACLSGGLRTPAMGSGGGSTGFENQKVCLFLSSRSYQSSWESPGLKNGYFTYFLLAGLRGGADTDKNRIVTARELFDFVNPKVRQYSNGAQVPVMWGKFEDTMEILNWRK